MKILHQIRRARRKGFTLIEVVLALAIAGFMLTAIFSMADATVKTTSNLVEVQSSGVTRDAFFTLMKKHFSGLPGNCRMELTFNEDSRGRYLSDMTFQNVPTSFNWGEKSIATEALRLSTRPDAEGTMDIVLSYYDQPILDSDESLAERNIEPIAEIVLLKEVLFFEWKVADGRNLAFPFDWNDKKLTRWDWNIRGRRPAQVELQVKFADTNELVRRVFWIPSKQSPVTRMRSLQQRSRSGRRNDGSGNGNSDQGGNDGQGAGVDRGRNTSSGR